MEQKQTSNTSPSRRLYGAGGQHRTSNIEPLRRQC